MIISASRREDIPAFRAAWFMESIRAGFCEVASPFDRKKIRRVSLVPADVDAIVFWTRDPGPLFGHLDELDGRGYRYDFLYTLCDYPPALEPGSPSLAAAMQMFRRLAERVGPARVVWRYDPILLSPALGPDFHIERFGRIAEALAGATGRVIISFYDEYPFTRTRMKRLEASGLAPIEPDPAAAVSLARAIADAARSRGMSVQSCAEKLDLRPAGVRPGRCIDPERIHRLFGVDVPSRKDRGQRPLCGCAPSRDIGAYDICGRGCLYCYATRETVAARRRAAPHDPRRPRSGD